MVASPVAGTTYTLSSDATATVEMTMGEGFSSVVVGDLDLDGQADLVVGAPTKSSGDGAGYLFLGPVEGDLETRSADGQFDGSSSEYAGFALASCDVDADGAAELYLSAPLDDSEASGGGGLYALHAIAW